LPAPPDRGRCGRWPGHWGSRTGETSPLGIHGPREERLISRGCKGFRPPPGAAHGRARGRVLGMQLAPGSGEPASEKGGASWRRPSHGTKGRRAVSCDTALLRSVGSPCEPGRSPLFQLHRRKPTLVGTASQSSQSESRSSHQPPSCQRIVRTHSPLETSITRTTHGCRYSRACIRHSSSESMYSPSYGS